MHYLHQSPRDGRIVTFKATEETPLPPQAMSLKSS